MNKCLAAQQALSAAFTAGHRIGFLSSSEGWNGEYPLDAVDYQQYQDAVDYAHARWLEKQKEAKDANSNLWGPELER